MRRLRFWQGSLVARLVFYFLLLSLVTVVLMGLVAYQQASSSLQSAVLSRLVTEATLKADALAYSVDIQQQEFQLLSEMVSIRRLLGDLLSQPPDGPGFRATYNSVAAQFVTIVDRKSEWKEILVLSSRGEVLLSTDPGHEKDYRILDSFFTEGLRGPHIEKVYPAPPNYKPTMTLSAPVGGADAPGVLAIHLDLAWLDTIMRSTGLSETGESYLVDTVNVLLSGQRFGTEEFRRGVHSLGIEQAIGGVNGAGRYSSYRGVPVLGVYRYVEALNVGLLVEVPEAEAFAPARELLAAMVGVGVGAVLVLAVGTFLLARQIAGPVLAVRDAAVAVTKGDLQARAPVRTRDEVGTLAQAFNQMSERTSGLIAELQVRNEELGRFTYTVSHDLKSPLVTIHGFLGFLEKDLAAGNTKRVADDVTRIRGATDTMQRLLDELLELSRIGRMINQPEDVLLSALVEEVIAATEGYHGPRGIDIRVDTKQAAVHGDRVRIGEVFQNLVENAARFMGDEPEPHIEIGAEFRGQQIVCHVRDNGVGIEPRYHEKVFGLFERLDASTDGTGIGLALVKNIVELHGGRIWIESEGSGHGTTFLFTLPASNP